MNKFNIGDKVYVFNFNNIHKDDKSIVSEVIINEIKSIDRITDRTYSRYDNIEYSASNSWNVTKIFEENMVFSSEKEAYEFLIKKCNDEISKKCDLTEDSI